MATSIKDRIQSDMKDAMRAKDQTKLSAIRYLLASIKRKEVDERISLDDAQTIDVLTKEAKQRRESISQFTDAARQDLVDKETAELELILTYLPKQLTELELDQIINEQLTLLGATSIKDLGRVMAAIKPLIQGRADGSVVSRKIKERLV